MATPYTIYKLIVLYMLQNADDTLTNSQISEFILDQGYTNYFHLQQALSELVEAELVNKDTRSTPHITGLQKMGAKPSPFSSRICLPKSSRK